MNSRRLARGVLALAMALVIPGCGPGTSVTVGVGVAYPGVGMGVEIQRFDTPDDQARFARWVLEAEAASG